MFVNPKIKNIILVSILSSGFFSVESHAFFKLFTQGRNISNLNSSKVLDIDFNTNEIINNITGKKYNFYLGSGRLENSVKGKGFEGNGDVLFLPTEDIKFEDTVEEVTVSLMYKFDTDTDAMLFSFGRYDLYHARGALNFNTGNGDYWGVPFTPSKDKWINITAVFNKRDVRNNKLYIDGVKQNLSNLRPETSSVIPFDPFNESIHIGGWASNEEWYRMNDKSMIDEVKVFKRAVNDAEAKKLASTHRMPELYIENKDDYVLANWATEILDSDVLYNFGFEDTDSMPTRIDWAPNKDGDINGGQSFTTTPKYSGNRSLHSPKTWNGYGNHYNFPEKSSDKNIAIWSDVFRFRNGTKLSMSIRTKNNFNGDVGVGNKIRLIGNGGWKDKLHTINNSRLVYDAPAGTNQIVVNNIDNIRLGSYITSDTSDKYDGNRENPRQIKNIVKESEGQYRITVDYPFASDQKAGSPVRYRVWYEPVIFDYIHHTNEDWSLYNSNATVWNDPDFDTWERGTEFYLNQWNNGDSYIDEFKLGYATKVKLYRDESLIYEGYDSSYNDTDARDEIAPTLNIISKDSSFDNDSVNTVINVDSIDKGNSYSYAIKSIDKDGKDTFLTENKVVKVESGLKGFSYVIDKNKETIPDNTVDTTSKVINHSVPNSDKSIYYLHIKAIDNANNVSETTHLKITTLKPELNLEVSTDKPTNSSVVITANVLYMEDFDYIVLPNGQKIFSQTVDYTVLKNGMYSFIGVSQNGDSIVDSIIVSNIDKKNPEISINKNPDKDWTNSNVDVTINASD